MENLSDHIFAVSVGRSLEKFAVGVKGECRRQLDHHENLKRQREQIRATEKEGDKKEAEDNEREAERQLSRGGKLEVPDVLI